MSSRFSWLVHIAATILACSSAVAFERPIGDLGRPRDSVVHDRFMPSVGRMRAELSGEPVSAFNLTDEEHEMHDRVWRFLVAPHANDWFMDTVVELQRTRIAGGGIAGFKRDRYYRWLRQTRYASSRTRFHTIADHANSDVDTLPSTFAAICAVIEVDRRRAAASHELYGLGTRDVAARRAENDMFVGWFTSALRYRYESYNFALDALLVETPHREAIDADGEISALAVYVERAERGDFCSGIDPGQGYGREPIPSRVLMNDGDAGLYRK